MLNPLGKGILTFTNGKKQRVNLQSDEYSDEYMDEFSDRVFENDVFKYENVLFITKYVDYIGFE